MSRHRNVRAMIYSEEYDGYDEVYGNSMDEESCMSPTDAQQWMYDRNQGQQSVASFMTNDQNIKEESDEETDAVADELHKKLRRDSDNFKMPDLNENEQVLLESCMDEIRSIVGENTSERQMVETIMKHKFDCSKALDEILNSSSASTITPIATPIVKRTTEPRETDSKPPLSLSDLLKQRTASNGQSETKKFQLACIFGQNKTNAIDASSSLETMKFNNLSELANAHLSTAPSTPSIKECDEKQTPSINIPQSVKQDKLFIPKLRGGSNLSLSPSSSETPTPHELSLKKIMDLRCLSISDQDNVPTTTAGNGMIDGEQKCLVDLTFALNKPGSASSMVVPEKRAVETIDFKFNDCDSVAEPSTPMPIVTHDCCLNISGILRENLENRSKNTSPLGKILCSRFKCKSIPHIHHGFQNKHKIQPFSFDVAIVFKPNKK